MMAGLNKATLIGKLGRDPEIRAMANGDKVCNFSIATSETWKDKVSGEKKESTEWNKITIWNQNLVRLAENYLKKGTQVYIEGKIQTRKYEKDGRDVYTTEIVIGAFDGKIVLLGGSTSSEKEDAPAEPYDKMKSAPSTAPLDDDIPF